MALIFADGFDHYGTGTTGRANMLKGQWASMASINDQPRTTYARTGDHSLYVVGGPVILSLRGEKLVTGVGYGQLVDSLPVTSGYRTGIVFYNQTGDAILNVTLLSDGALRILKGDPTSSDTNLLDITDAVVMAGAFGHVEMKIVIDDVVGSFELRYNGNIISQLTDLNLGTDGVASIGFINVVGGSQGVGQYIDDLIVWDDTGTLNNTFMGQQRLLTVYPTSDKTAADWSLTGAISGYDTMNETVPDEDTTYISSSTVGDKSEFGFSALPAELDTVAAVFIPVMAKSDEAGISSIKLSMLNGAGTAAGTEHELTSAYVYYRDAFNANPDGGGAWTKAAFEASTIRIEKTA